MRSILLFVGQLCLCISTLVVRHASWDASSVLRQLSSAFEGSSQAPQPLLGPGLLETGALQWLGPLLELLALLPEECQNRKVVASLSAALM